MTRKRLLAAAAIGLTAAIIPVTTGANATFGVELSTAACAEGDCGRLSLADCFCPDMQFPNLMPRCDEPLAD